MIKFEGLDAGVSSSKITLEILPRSLTLAFKGFFCTVLRTPSVVKLLQALFV